MRHPWTSPPILALLAVALVMGGFFVLRLMTAPEPLIPIAILAHPIVRCAIIANAFGWGSIIGLNIVLPIYLQAVIGLSPTSAGLSLVMFMVALNTSAGLAGQVLGRVRRYKLLPMIGLLISTAAVATLAWQADTMTPLAFELLVIVIGLGFGPLPSLTSVAMQNVVAAPPARHLDRNHEFQPQPLRHHADRGVRGDRAAGAPAGEALGIAEGYGRAFLVTAASLAVALIAVRADGGETAADQRRDGGEVKRLSGEPSRAAGGTTRSKVGVHQNRVTLRRTAQHCHGGRNISVNLVGIPSADRDTQQRCCFAVRKLHSGLPLGCFLWAERALFARELFEVNGVDPQIIVVVPGDGAAVIGRLRFRENLRLVERQQNIAASRNPTGELDLIGATVLPFDAEHRWADDGDALDARRLVHRRSPSGRSESGDWCGSTPPRSPYGSWSPISFRHTRLPALQRQKSRPSSRMKRASTIWCTSEAPSTRRAWRA